MYLVGLTGGIAAGKSAVAELWSELGATVIDADLLAREVVEPGTSGLKELEDLFGPEIISADNCLNRKKLAELVFKDSELRLKLEAVVHPLIQSLSRERIMKSESEIVVYVIPLLAETNSELPFDLVVTVEAPESLQIERLVEKRAMTREEAVLRIKSQASAASRAKLSDHILNSNQELALLKKDANKLFSEIKRFAQMKRDQA
jgi:dephospho-CoA kinase